MKKFFSTLLLFILVASMLLSCGEDPVPTPDDDEEDDVVDVTDNGAAMGDPSIGKTEGGIDITGTGFIDQLEQVQLNTSDPNNPTVPNFNYGTESTNLVTYYPSAESIINVGRREVPPYGIYGFIHEFSEYYDDMIDIGFTNVRLGMHSVNDLTDEIMSELCSSGISTMYTVGRALFSNQNINDPTDYFLGTSNEEAQYVNLETFRIAEWIEDTINGAFKLVDRYGPNGQFFKDNPDINYLPIRYIEICNEPNFQYMLPLYRPGTTTDWANAPAKAQLYAMLFVAMSEAIHVKYGDQIKIVGISDGCVGGTDATFTKMVLGYHKSETYTHMLNTAIQLQESKGLQTLLGLEDGEEIEMDILKNMDVISTHPYWGPSPFTQDISGNSPARCLSEMRRAIAAIDPEAVDRIEIWFTECGQQLKGRKWFPAEEAEQWGVFPYSSARTGVDQLTQASFLVQNYIYALRCGVSRITFMNMQDTDNCNYGAFNYKSGGGVGDKSWRMSAYAIQNLINILPNPRLVNVIHEGYDEIAKHYYYLYEFESDVGGENVILAFTAQEKHDLYVPWDDDYALVTDLMGNTQILAAENGKIHLDGGPCMMYVRKVSNDMLIENGLIPAPEADLSASLALCWQEKREEY